MKSLITIKTIKEHNLIKNKILNIIDSCKGNNFFLKNEATLSDEKISKTDWHLKDLNLEYKKLINSKIIPYIKENRYTNLILGDIWFQQYYEGDVHGWHVHANCQFSHVYFLELPQKKYATQFFFDKLIKVNVNEGDLLSFPSHFIHRGPLIEKNTRKTIIAFNSSFDGVNIKYINSKI